VIGLPVELVENAAATVPCEAAEVTLQVSVCPTSVSATSNNELIEVAEAFWQTDSVCGEPPVNVGAILITLMVNPTGVLLQVPLLTVIVALYTARGAAAGTTSVIGDTGNEVLLTSVKPAPSAAAL
jgi:hypothetical protein